MRHRLLIILFLLFSTLEAEPTMVQVQQAISQNPAILETPQAKALMQEKGVSSSEVKEKVSSQNETKVEETTSEIAENDIDTTVEDVTNSDSDLHKVTAVAKRVNPFFYKSSGAIRAEMNAKQQSASSSLLARYSMVFYANKNTLDSSSLPTPDDYIISTDDKIGIHVYGDRNKNYSISVKSDGTIDLDFIGPLQIGGMKFIDAKKYLMNQLKVHFKISDFHINIEKYSTIQATLIGDVKFPGLYNLSSFSSVKDLLIVSKGVRDSASVRNIVVKRESKIVAKLDFYDLLFKGDSFDTFLLKHGDVVIINKAEKLVSIDGYVNHTARFELKEDETLRTLIDYAGGMKPDASKAEIKIDRYDDNAKLETFKVSYKDSKKFAMKNGDKVYIYPLDFTAQNSVNIYGNVIRPGTYALNKEKTLNELLKVSLKDGVKKFFLPNTYFDYGVINRYGEDLQYVSKSFNLSKVISNQETVALSPNDKIYIFSLNDIYSSSYVTTKGSTLIKPGKLQYIAGITIKDAINASGIEGVLDDRIRLTTFATDDFMPETSFYSLKEQGDTVLNPYDELEVYDYYSTHILEPIIIKGEVVKPTTVFYEKGMTMSDLIHIAGGFNKTAYTKSISVLRYYVDETQTRQQKVIKYDLDKVKLNEIKLEPYDEVKISKILGWGTQDFDVVSISGEVNNPIKVKYGKGMTLSDLLVMAGGLNKMAYTKSISITRYFIDETQTRQQKSLSFDLEKMTFDEIKLEPYDEVKISKILGWDSQDFETVSIVGEVHTPITTKYGKGMTLEDLSIMAGGFNKRAYKRNIEIVRYHLDENQTRQRTILKIDTEDKALSEINLEAYDEVRIFKIPQWSEHRTVVVAGEVKFPGTYAIDNGETLSNVLRRAGGYTEDAFIEGSVFTRESIRKNQVEQYNQSLAKIKRELALYNAMPANAKKVSSSGSESATLNEVVLEAQKYQPIGRVSLMLDGNISKFQNSEFDLVLKDKDSITVPSKIDTVTVFGEVFNPTAFVYNLDKNVEDYINMASGFSRAADEDSVYVIHANGTSEPIGGGWFSASVEIQKGDTIVVPIYIRENNTLDIWDSVAKILSSFALTAAAIHTLGVI